MKNKSFLYLLIFFVLLAILFSFFPDKFQPALKSSLSSLFQFTLILPAIILLIGIFTILVTPEMVIKNFGQETKFLGALKALALGSLMSTGPFYLSFPMAKNFLDKGARISNVMIFVSAWNGVGIIAEIVEFHFMGPTFMFIRFVLNIAFILLSGYVAEFLYNLISPKGYRNTPNL